MLTKSEIVNEIHKNEATGLTKDQISKVVNATFGTVSEALRGGNEVRIDKFGTFNVNDRPERQGRNPSTGAAVTIAASKAVKFKASKALKDLVA